MTRERAKELLPVMQAYAEGKEVQYRASDYERDEWISTGDPIWFGHYDYRIKPEPPQPEEKWFLCLFDGFSTKAHAETYLEVHGITDVTPRLFREVVQ